MAEETIGRATVQLGADGSKLAPEMAAAMAKAQGELERANKKMERAHASTMKAIQGHLDKINATKPTHEMRLLEQAVEKLGGTSKLTKDQLHRVTVEVNALAAAGAKVPATLKGLEGSATGLSAAFRSLTTGGGVSGALAAIGPAGVAAAGAFGAVTIAGGAALHAMADLAAEGERWANLAKQTGLGVIQVQQLSALLEDAGIPAEALGTAMKELQKEIAGGGKELAKFGIDVADLKAMSPEEQFRAMAEKIAAIEDPADRTAVALAAFGRSGTELIPVMEDVVNGADKMYGALSEGQIEALQNADDKLDDFGRRWSLFWKTSLAETIDWARRIGQAGTQGGNVHPMNLLGRFFGPAGGPQAAPAGGPSAAAQAAEVERKRRVAELDAAEARKKAEREHQENQKKAAKKQEEITELLERARQSARKLAFELMADAQKASRPTKGFLGIESLPQARGLGPGAMVGAQNFAFGLDAQGFVTWGEAAKEAADNTKGAAQETIDYTDKLADLAETMHGFGGILGAVGAAVVSVMGSFSLLKKIGTGADGKFSFGNLKAGMKTFEGKMAAGGAAAGALGALGGALGGGNSVAGSALGGAAAGAQMGAIAGPWGMAAGALIGGAIGFFKGSKLKKEAKEAGKILGENVSVEQLKALKEQAKAAGQDWKTYLKEMKKEQERQAKIEKRQKLEAGLTQAAQFAQQLQDRIAAGTFSDKMKAAADVMIGKVREALLKSGMGMQLDVALAKSEAFQGAQGAAGDIAGILSGMREAGMVDTGLMEAAAASSQELFNQAVAAALEAGKAPEEAQKAGFGAISQLLREQLNASKQSGQDLDANTQALLDEAKKNGIEILADPAIESLNVQKEQLDVLRDIAGQTRGGGRSVPAARGFGPMITPNLEGGLGPRIQTHAGEYAMVIPRSRMGPDGLISAATGLFRTNVKDGDRDGGRDREPGDRPGGGGGEQTGAPGTEPGMGGAPSPAAVEEQLERIAAKIRPITIATTVAPQITEDPLATKERKEDLRRFTIEQLRRVARERDPETMFLLKRALGLS